jgi:hypothetical protein
MRSTLVFALASSCTDVHLWRPGTLERVSVTLERPTPIEPKQDYGLVPRAGERVRYRIGDAFCTKESIEVIVPFKILVIIDYSGSMDQADPGGLRIQAVEELVTTYADDPSVYFGFLRFGGTTFPLPDLGKDFTNDRVRIAGALAQLRQNNTVPDGQTNYQASLEWAWEAIDDDMSRPEQVPGTRYGILFVTDGRPNVPEAGDADQALAANRPKIRDRMTGCDGYKAHQPLNTMVEWINTYFINVQNADPLAAQLLRDMAEGASNDACGPDNWGRGVYQEVANAADLVFDLDLPKLRKVFVNRTGFVFMNYHLRAAYQDGEMVMAKDSDGDGLPDFIESADVGSDPWKSSMFRGDTDGDGISDLVAWSLGMQTNRADIAEIYARPPPDPGLAQIGMLVELGPILRHEEDDDADGLSDSEESFIGTDHLLVDSDRDGLSDLVELRFLLNPLDPTDAAVDSDGDGLDNKSEAETGMDPHHQEPAWFRDAYAYQIHRGNETEIEVPSTDGGPPRVRTCYEFLVSNILFRKPVLPDGTLGDFNLFEISFIDQTRVPIGDTEFVSRRETMLARPTEDRPLFYFRRELPEHW